MRTRKMGETPPPSQRHHGAGLGQEIADCGPKWPPIRALVSAFENDLRLLSRDFDPCKKCPKQIQPAKERFLKRVWAGTPFLFVPQTPKP